MFAAEHGFFLEDAALLTITMLCQKKCDLQGKKAGQGPVFLLECVC